MTFSARHYIVLTLLLTFSVQLLASAVPPCPMLSAGPDSLSHTPETMDSAQAPTDHTAMGHGVMDHAGMGHGASEQRVIEEADSTHMPLAQALSSLTYALQNADMPMTMDCCDADQSCNMDMCLMAPAVPSLVYFPVDFSVNAKPALAAQLIFALIVETPFHPPRIA